MTAIAFPVASWPANRVSKMSPKMLFSGRGSSLGLVDPGFPATTMDSTTILCFFAATSLFGRSWIYGALACNRLIQWTQRGHLWRNWVVAFQAALSGSYEHRPQPHNSREKRLLITQVMLCGRWLCLVSISSESLVEKDARDHERGYLRSPLLNGRND